MHSYIDAIHKPNANSGINFFPPTRKSLQVIAARRFSRHSENKEGVINENKTPIENLKALLAKADAMALAEGAEVQTVSSHPAIEESLPENSTTFEKIVSGDNLCDFPSSRKLYNFLEGEKFDQISENLEKIDQQAQVVSKNQIQAVITAIRQTPGEFLSFGEVKIFFSNLLADKFFNDIFFLPIGRESPNNIFPENMQKLNNLLQSLPKR